jgi:Fe-S cluster assembly iron-binding protein IscA
MYELAQVEQAENDEVFKIDEITILMDPLVISHLEGDIVIDHKKNYGFILKNSYEILTFGMKLIKNS